MAKKQQNLARRIWNAVKPSFLSRNAMYDDLRVSDVPLLNGSLKYFGKDTSPILLSDPDYYKGYLYSAIKKRANRVAQLATENVGTKIKDDLEAPIHPYLALIDESPSFPNYFFWSALSTFIDLQGEAYIYVLRNFTETKVGNPVEFKLINPYHIQRIYSKDGKLGGYRETRGAMYRDLPLQQVIYIHNLNPFNLGEGYAMTDAAKESHYLHHQSGAFTRHALNKNVGQRGLITTDVILEDADYENFKARVRESGGVNGAGDFLFGNGPGAINYTDMQIDLDKLALKSISEVSAQELFAVAGVSKTIMGIEVSGVTRETGKVQQDNFDRMETIPQLQTIIDALNQDYKNNYKEQYTKTPALIYIDSPLKTDREAELKDAETMKTKAEAVKVLVDTGFDPNQALELVGLDELAFVKEEPTETPDDTQEHVHKDEEDITFELNATGPNDSLSGVIKSKETSLENDVVNIQKQLLQAIVKKVSKNDITSEQEQTIITKTDKKSIIEQLEVVLATFALGTIDLFANRTLRKRLEQFGLGARFTINADVQNFIKQHSKLAADSHIESVLEEVYKKARELADAGLGREERIAQLRNLFGDKINKARATRIARTESNRVMAESQYQADLQFIKQNELGERAFKRWVVRSSNPCPYCLELQSRTTSNPIPFTNPFVNKGGTVDATDGDEQKTYVAGYEPIESGTLHPNCSCVYEIIIKKD